MSAAEVAQGTRYTEALTTSWRPPKHYRDMTEEECDKLREKWSILVDVSWFSSAQKFRFVLASFRLFIFVFFSWRDRAGDGRRKHPLVQDK